MSMPNTRSKVETGLQPLVVSYREAARLLCLEHSTVRKLVSDGRLSAVRFPGQTRASGIVYADLVALCEKARAARDVREKKATTKARKEADNACA